MRNMQAGKVYRYKGFVGRAVLNGTQLLAYERSATWLDDVVEVVSEHDTVVFLAEKGIVSHWADSRVQPWIKVLTNLGNLGWVIYYEHEWVAVNIKELVQ